LSSFARMAWNGTSNPDQRQVRPCRPSCQNLRRAQTWMVLLSRLSGTWSNGKLNSDQGSIAPCRQCYQSPRGAQTWTYCVTCHCNICLVVLSLPNVPLGYSLRSPFGHSHFSHHCLLYDEELAQTDSTFRGVRLTIKTVLFLLTR
jgi:hypothetical protein